MIRKIIRIDENKCNGCGACTTACHEGAISLVDGKAKLLRDDYCDGLGNCLPACPVGAITFEDRDAAAFDENVVRQHMEESAGQGGKHHDSHGHHHDEHHEGHGHHHDENHEGHGHHHDEHDEHHDEHHDGHHGVCGHHHGHEEAPRPMGCPGSMARSFSGSEPARAVQAEAASELRQWPIQLKLAPITAPYFQNANLLVAADCAAYAHGDFHRKFLRGRVALIGCPKLDEGDYSEKLTEIIRRNNIKSVTVVRMEVPCCGGIENAAKTALQNSGKFIPWQVITLSVDGRVIDGE
jgi:NAD-dependent dihydropyrimidine dehydrogenase PreA subunit